MYQEIDGVDKDTVMEWKHSHEVLNEIKVCAEMLIRFNAPWATKEYNKGCQDVGRQILNMIDGVPEE